MAIVSSTPALRAAAIIRCAAWPRRSASGFSHSTVHAGAEGRDRDVGVGHRRRADDHGVDRVGGEQRAEVAEDGDVAFDSGPPRPRPRSTSATAASVASSSAAGQCHVGLGDPAGADQSEPERQPVGSPSEPSASATTAASASTCSAR